ncbi:hypothetical protein CPB97_010454 [Podila verticillata]|nr:hypothetical protein CPB97_010454 [Podila verticillata]
MTSIPQITTTVATSSGSAEAEAPAYFTTTTSTTTTHIPSTSDKEYTEKSLKDYMRDHDSLKDAEEILQPHQRRAVDSHDLSHQDDLAASNLGLAFSDPMLAITQLNGDRRASIASSLHSNLTAVTASASRNHYRQQQLQMMDEKKKQSMEVDSTQGGPGATSGDHHHQDDDRNLEAYILPEVDDGAPPMDTSWYGYVIVVASFIIYFIVFGTEHTFGVYQEYYSSPQAEPWLKNTTSQGVAMIGTLATTFTYLLGAFSGRFADRAGYRISAVMGAVIMGAGLIGASFAKSLSTLYICQGVVLGVGSSLVYLPAVSCPAHWFERYRSIAIGIVVCGSGLGGLVLGPLTEFLISRVGVQWTLRFQGILCLVGIGGSGMLLKTRVRKVAAFAVFHGETATTGALLIGILNGASLLGRLSLGFVTDRVGRINMLFICALISGLSILCIWSVATTVPVLTAFAVVYGFTCGGYFSVIPSVIADIYGLDRLTTVTGLLYGSIGFGYLIGSPVSGYLLDITKPNTSYVLAIFYLKYWRSNGRWFSHI